MTHGDGGKGSARRKEDASKVRDNWDLIFGRKSAGAKKKDTAMEDYRDDDDDEQEEVICTNCGTEMSPTEHGRWLHCDVCGNTRDFDDQDDISYE